MSNPALRFFLHGIGWENGLCSRFMSAADDLISVAQTLRGDLEQFRKAPDPFAALVSTVHNNQEFEKYAEHLVDTGTKSGVEASPIETVRSRTTR